MIPRFQTLVTLSTKEFPGHENGLNTINMPPQSILIKMLGKTLKKIEIKRDGHKSKRRFSNAKHKKEPKVFSRKAYLAQGGLEPPETSVAVFERHLGDGVKSTSSGLG